jgi:hypothetical protein
MQVKGCLAHSPELGQPEFSNAPEAFDAVYMGLVSNEFIVAMIDSEVLAITDIDETIIAAPAVRVNHTLRLDLSPDDGLQRGFGTIRDDFGIDFPVAFEDAEDNRFTIGAAPSFSFNAQCSKE